MDGYDFRPDRYEDSIRRLCEGYVILPGKNGKLPARTVPPLDRGLAVSVRRAAGIYLRLHAAHPDVEIVPPGEYTFWVARMDGRILACEPSLHELVDTLDQLLPASYGGEAS